MSSSWTNWSRGSNPAIIGTTGSANIRANDVVDVGPEHVGAAEDRDVDVACLSAKSITDASASTTSRSIGRRAAAASASSPR